MYKWKFLIATLFLTGCQPADKGPGSVAIPDTTAEQTLYAVLYQQQAAESRALYYQAFNLARLVFDAHNPGKKPRCIITDIDETVLDNSPYQAQCILAGFSYPVRWSEWCLKAKAEALPGSLKFLKHVEKQGAEVFYVTNRKENLRDATIKNLRICGFPYADNKHVLMRNNTSSKEKYRRIIEENYDVVLLLGDNLSDFSGIFDSNSPSCRNRIADSMNVHFGNKFIVFPNAMYGDWEQKFYGEKTDLGIKVKDSLRKSFLKGF